WCRSSVCRFTPFSSSPICAAALHRCNICRTSCACCPDREPMANDQSEEKTLPPTRKKLRDAREKGQVARSRDLTSGISLAGAIGFLMLSGATIVAAAVAMFETAGNVAAGDFTLGLDAVSAAVLH